jgi:hypothetical protein
MQCNRIRTRINALPAVGAWCFTRARASTGASGQAQAGGGGQTGGGVALALLVLAVGALHNRATQLRLGHSHAGHEHLPSL